MARYRKFKQVIRNKKSQSFGSLSYQFLEVIKNINRYKFASFSSLVSVTVIFLILSSFLLFMININKFVSILSSKASMVVYLKKSLNKGVIDNLTKKIINIKGIKELKYISQEEALKEMKNSLGKNANIFAVLAENPLPASLEVKFEKVGMSGLKDERVVAKIAALISNMPGVDEVDYGYKIFDVMIKAVKIIKITFIGVLLVFSFFTILLLTNTLRLALFARRNEIDIMKLIGVTNWSIRLPFLIEGIALSSLGCILSLVLLWVLFNIILQRLEIYALISHALIFLSWKHCLGIIMLSLFFGLTSSYMAFFSLFRQR